MVYTKNPDAKHGKNPHEENLFDNEEFGPEFMTEFAKYAMRISQRLKDSVKLTPMDEKAHLYFEMCHDLVEEMEIVFSGIDEDKDK